MIEEDSLVTVPEFSKDDIDNICRVCLQEGILKSVFSDDEVPKLSQKINECASVEIQKGDGLPENICDYCISELNLAYYFRNQCRLSDAKLRRAFQRNFDENEEQEGEIITDDLNIVNNNQKTVANNENSHHVRELETVLIETKHEPILEPTPPPLQPLPPPEPVPLSSDEIFPVPSPDPVNNTRIEEFLFVNQCNVNVESEIAILQSQNPLQDFNLAEYAGLTKKSQTSTKSKSEKVVGGAESSSNNINQDARHRYACSFCSKTFLFQTRLRRHEAKHITDRTVKTENGVEAEKISYDCSVCNKSFLFLSRLRQHEATHSTERPYKCDICDKAFVRKDTLNSHVTTHEKIKPFKCDKCVAHFTRKNSLNKHYYVHTNSKQFKCMICFKIFGRRDNFNIHMKSHKGVKSFQCPKCDKSFVRSDVLMRHKKIHEESTRKYICAICLKTYSRPDVLRSHLKQHVKKFDNQF